MSNSDTRIYIDSETNGLHSVMVLFQFAVEDGPITLYEVWKKPVGETLDLLEWVASHTVVGFNLAFDWFHVVKIYTIWSLLPRDWIPEDHVDRIAELEPEAQNGPCIKPANALDLLLHSRKGPYQNLMARSDIRIRRVPTPLAYALAQELEERVEIDGIYFAKSHDKDAPRWSVFDIKRRDGEIDTNFKDVVLRFRPAGGLKFLAEHALGLQPKYHYRGVEPDPAYRPKELGYAPYALAVSSAAKNWEVYKVKDGERKLVGHAWPGVVKKFIDHWHTRADARDYATDDIVYTRALDKHFGKQMGLDCVPAGDDDSVLACMVPVVRWRGFETNRKGIRKLLKEALRKVKYAPVNINKAPDVRRYIGECMDDMEQVILRDSTKKANVIAVSKWNLNEPEPCTKCEGASVPCHRCNGTGTMVPQHEHPERGNHPAAVRAYEVLQIKYAKKEIELFGKLLRAKKFHASFNVIGAMSSRMSGADGLNAQGIKATKEVRSLFDLAWEGYLLCGGDFDAFEIVLADAVYDDPDLRKALKAGKKIHALFAMCMYPGKTYEEILASAGTSFDMYVKGKAGVFSLLYAGDWTTLVKNLGIAPEVAKAAFDTWNKWFPQSAKAREKTFAAFCSMSQPDGTHVHWADPTDYVESLLGFRRYFTLENTITKVLFDLARKMPKVWRDCKIKVIRSPHKGVQFACGAVASALYGAAFQIQAANQRAACNHVIQSAGAQLTKAVQRKIWDLQPAGVNPLYIACANVHDEILSVTHPDYVEAVAQTVKTAVESYRDRVPLLAMTWNKEMANWAEKKSGSVTLKIQPETAT